MDYDKHEKAYIKGQELIGKLMSANKTFFTKNKSKKNSKQINKPFRFL